MDAKLGYKWCYLSPHLDDAVFSCGGQIHRANQAGESVCVVSIFTADEPSSEMLTYDARCLHLLWGLLTGVYAERRSEDAKACHQLSATALHLGFKDCIYRRDDDSGTALYSLNSLTNGEIRSPDAELLRRIIAAFRKLPYAETVVAPVGLHSGHVDHMLVRIAAEIVFQSGTRLLYYEDLPYACDVDLVSRLTEYSQWESEVYPLSKDNLEAKLFAVEAYQSQLFDVFRGKNAREVLSEYAQRVGGERIWRKNKIDWYQVLGDANS